MAKVLHCFELDSTDGGEVMISCRTCPIPDDQIVTTLAAAESWAEYHEQSSDDAIHSTE